MLYKATSEAAVAFTKGSGLVAPGEEHVGQWPVAPQAEPVAPVRPVPGIPDVPHPRRALGRKALLCSGA